ncbi:MAG: DUF5675 family protein [Calditrichia bacterium]
MEIVEIIRLEENWDQGTFGVLKINKEVFCCTLEPPDRLNAQNISSIPAQQYICERYRSLKYGETFQVTNVPGRLGILIHAGNVVGHTKGCIILGQYFGKLGANRAVLNSGNTFREFMELMNGTDRFHLTIHQMW